MKSKIFESSIDTLATLLEEGTRASRESTKRFVEPMGGTLYRAKSKRHHIIFGRRGSGKSSLLMKTEASLRENGSAIAFVDLGPYKGHQYPDILISVLIEGFGKILLDIEGVKQGVFRLLLRLFRSSRLKKSLIERIKKEIIELKRILHLTDDAQVTERSMSAERSKASTGASLTLNAQPQGLPVSSGVQATSEDVQSNQSETEEEYRRSKVDYLLRKIIDYRSIFSDVYKVTGKDSYFILDDFYQIIDADQPRLVDYIHNIAKGSRLWLKVGTIRHRSKLYIVDRQPIGLKLGDDADEINLDITLEKYSTLRKFFSEVLNSYLKESGVKREQIISDGAFERLVIASGGVARDLLGILRRSIEEARERLQREQNHPYQNVTAEDVNIASGKYGDLKTEEFRLDASGEGKELETMFNKIRKYCLERNKTNIFLVNQNSDNADVEKVHELIDLRLIHHVKYGVTISGRQGEKYRALLLDVSQYTGARQKRGIEMVEFWGGDREILRKNKYIFDPSKEIDSLVPLDGDRPEEDDHETGNKAQLDIKF